MTDAEGEKHFATMIDQIKLFSPDEIVAVNRSGYSYAMWAAQILGLPLGTYWPESTSLVSETPAARRIVFVDDNIMTGTTFSKAADIMSTYFPDIEWKWAVLFSDWTTPQHIKDQIIQGTVLDYYATEPVWGSRKISKDFGIRHRDE